MSYILDALRRSEQERQKGKTPSLHSIHSGSQFATPRSAPSRWPWLVAGALLGLMGLAAYVWLPRPAAVPAPAARADAALATPPATAAAVPSASLPAASQVQAPAPSGSDSVMEKWQLPPAVQQSLPVMKFSLHAWSSQPAKRSVVINERLMREGMEVSPGLRLREITPDGVILDTGGYRVRMPIVDGW